MVFKGGVSVGQFIPKGLDAEQRLEAVMESWEGVPPRHPPSLTLVLQQ